jgi:SAM-dependent methyltransferase
MRPTRDSSLRSARGTATAGFPADRAALLPSLVGLLSPVAWRLNIAMPAGSGDRWPDDYERGRPGYPPEVVDLPGLPPASTVLDLGAGTGKLTRLLVTTFGRVVAVEPAEAMRRLLAMLCPDAQALAGTAEEIPLADASVDAVFAAEAFHWFDGERALGEITRVLRPQGALVAMWNLPAGPTEPSIADVEQLLSERAPSPDELGVDPLDLNTTRYAAGEWRLALARTPFEELQEARLVNPQTFDREGLVAFFASMGWIADLPDEDRVPLLDAVRSLLGADEYRRPWETHVCWTQLRAT